MDWRSLGYRVVQDLNVASGELWGNIPQTYSMVGLILSALRLSKPWVDAL